jgi:hypothetical protein
VYLPVLPRAYPHILQAFSQACEVGRCRVGVGLRDLGYPGGDTGPSCCYKLGRSSCAGASWAHARFRGPPDRVCMVRKHVTRGIQRMPVGGGPATHAYPPTVSLCPCPHAPIHTRPGRGRVGGQCCRPSEANLAPRRGSRDVERSLRRVPPAGAAFIPPAPHLYTHPRRGSQQPIGMSIVCAPAGLWLIPVCGRSYARTRPHRGGGGPGS